MTQQSDVSPERAIMLAQHYGYVVNVGQLDACDMRRLRKAHKDGKVVKFHGWWPWITYGTVKRTYWLATGPGVLNQIAPEAWRTWP